MKIVIAIPVYNCERQLPRVLDDIDEALRDRVEAIWVVDNGSTDATVQNAMDYVNRGRLGNLRVFRNLQNVNLGGTHKIVFNKAREIGATHVLILHGDDQATSSEANLLIDRAYGCGVQTILGSRFGRQSRLHGYDWKRVAGNRILNILYSATARRRLQDLGSGLNLFHLSDLPEASYMSFGNRLSFNYELILDLVRREVPFQFEPITWSETDQTSNARNVSIFREALLILIRWRFQRDKRIGAVGDTALEYDWTEVR